MTTKPQDYAKFVITKLNRVPDKASEESAAGRIRHGGVGKGSVGRVPRRGGEGRGRAVETVGRAWGEDCGEERPAAVGCSSAGEIGRAHV